MQKETLKQKRNENYNKLVDSITPQTCVWSSLLNAFWVGGLTCIIAQGIGDLYYYLFPDVPSDMIINYTSMTIIAIAILFTGFGFFDVIARKGGSGSFLPITGFANAMASASMEFKTEGLIMGTSVKMFSVVGPVVVNGIVWSSVAGMLHLLLEAI